MKWIESMKKGVEYQNWRQSLPANLESEIAQEEAEAQEGGYTFNIQHMYFLYFSLGSRRFHHIGGSGRPPRGK